MEANPVARGGWANPSSAPMRNLGAENYCTLFDVNYLPQALTMYTSLTTHDPTAVLWALCMDDASHEVLDRLELERLRLIPLLDVEEHFSEALANSKQGRTRGEYCWTLTPFLPGYVLEALSQHDPGRAHRVTYVDADCYFFSSPQRLLERFTCDDSHVFVTPHAYAPEYDQSEKAGVFCVQFLTIRGTARGRAVLEWWQSKCAEWCYARYEPGRFGDQKYLDEWPRLFGDDICILDDPRLALAPWNVEHYGNRKTPDASRLTQGPGEPPPVAVEPCLYHFHGLKALSPGRLELYANYRLSSGTLDKFYRPYVCAFESSLVGLKNAGHTPLTGRAHFRLGERYSRSVHTLRGELKTARLRY